MARSLEAGGHRVDILEPGSDPSRLAGYDFLFVGAEASTFAGKLPDGLAVFLKQSMALGGKRSLAFIRKSGLRPQKALERLMFLMEAEGMRVTCSEIVIGLQDAALVAASAPVVRASERG